MTTDTDALLATVREAFPYSREHAEEFQTPRTLAGYAALDSLAAELERVKAERDAAQARLALHRDARGDDFAALVARLDKALSALREIAAKPYRAEEVTARYFAEIEGEA